MKRPVLQIATALLTFVATLNAIGFIVFLALWVTIGDTHDEIWKVSKYPVIGIALVVPLIFLTRDMIAKSSRTGFRIRLLVSAVIVAFVTIQKVRSETARIKGWSAEAAALNVASSLYPGEANTMTLQETDREELNVLGRGPAVTYLVLSENQPICTVGVCRRYWLWWTCGMYETLKTKNAQPAGGAYFLPGAGKKSAHP